MQEHIKLSSKELLDNLLAKYGSDSVNEQQIHQMEREIEQQMDKFDITERERTAKVAEDLSKIVITA
ncbi:MAG: hypothetical protein HC867_00040 [Bacteroidia bacterium]|nr:hypothetical protein [Bacteroidia bacterium]